MHQLFYKIWSDECKPNDWNLSVFCPILKHVTAASHEFEVVKDFVYLGTSANSQNGFRLAIKRMITLANRCYLGLSAQLRSEPILEKRKQLCTKA